MDDVDRLFQYLVKHLQSSAPDYLKRPFQVSELYQRLIPYRLHRSGLGFDSIEDYEIAVLRLLAGEHGYAAVEPEDAQRALADEAELPNPTPGTFREFAAATMTLNRDAVQRFTRAEEAYAPPPEPAVQVPFAPSRSPLMPPTMAPEPAPPPPPAVAPNPVAVPSLARPGAGARAQNLTFEPVHGEAVACSGCAAPLPPARQVRFCPYCGLRLSSVECRRCGESVEPEWRYCPVCGLHADG
ncbi:MAG: zinc ribbon domain-containing protein [Gemmatimonadales bacterium]|nr:zinc ribbon domain-containing protein [Gemmatimonadales bacterium]